MLFPEANEPIRDQVGGDVRKAYVSPAPPSACFQQEFSALVYFKISFNGLYRCCRCEFLVFR